MITALRRRFTDTAEERGKLVDDTAPPRANGHEEAEEGNVVNGYGAHA